MNKLLKRLFRRKPKSFEVVFPVGGQLSDADRAWLFGEEETHDDKRTGT